MARHHGQIHIGRIIAALSLGLSAAACGQTESAPAYPPEEIAAFEAAAVGVRAATERLRTADILSDGGPSSTEIGQMYYEVYTALGDMIDARAGDDAFDAAATQVQGHAGDATGLAVRTFRREDLSANAEAFFADFDVFADAHMPPASDTPAE